MKLYKANAGQELVTTSDTQVGSSLIRTDSLSANYTATFTPTDWDLIAGRSYGIYLKCVDAPQDTQISIVFKYTL